MALPAFGATTLDGIYTKVFTVTAAVGDSGDLAVAFDGAAGRPTAMTTTPLYATICNTSAAELVTGAWVIAQGTLSANGVTVRKSVAGANTSTSALVTVRTVHSIDR